MKKISIVAVIAIDTEGRLLLVRKRGTTAFMQPGGKSEPNESETAALCRELAEELRWRVEIEQLERIGEFSAPAANEPDTEVHAALYLIRTAAKATPNAELEEIQWVDVDDARTLQIAPLTREHVLPFVEKLHRKTQDSVDAT